MDRERKLKIAKAKLKLKSRTPTKKLAFDASQAHPDFSGARGTLRRWGIKNFGGYGPEEFQKALNTQYPGKYDSKIVNGRLMIKDGDTYKALDPEGGGVGEFIADAGDLGTDVIQGVADSAGTVASGLAGAVATAPTGGIGAIPAAMAGGSATGAATETMKQQLAKMLGYRDSIDTGDVALNAGFGAASPLLFGTGQVGKQSIKKLSKSALNNLMKSTGKETAQEALDYAGRGVLKRSKDAISPKVLSKVTGVDEALIKQFPKYKDQIQQMTTVPHYLADRLDQVRQNTVDGFKTARSKAGRILGAMNDSIQGKIDTTGAKNILKERRDLLKDRFKSGSGMRSQLDDYIDFRNIEKDALSSARRKTGTEVVLTPGQHGVSPKAINRFTRQIPDQVSASDARALKSSLDDISQVGKTPRGVKPKFGKLENTVSKETKITAQNAALDLKEKMKQAIIDSGKFSREEVEQASKNYSSLQRLAEQVDSNFKSVKGFETLIDQGVSSKKLAPPKLLQDVADVAGTSDQINNISMLKRYANELVPPKSGSILNEALQHAANNAGKVGIAGSAGYLAAPYLMGGDGSMFGAARLGAAGAGAAASAFLNPRLAYKMLTRNRMRNAIPGGLRRSVYGQMLEVPYRANQEED